MKQWLIILQLHVNKIEVRITFKIKIWHCLEVLTPETMKLLGSAKNKITKCEDCENVPHLGFTEVIRVHCHNVNNYYQHDSRVLYTFVSDKLFGQLLNILPKNLTS